MINIENIQKALCQEFCSSITINTVPCGYAVSTGFEDSSGDRLGFYVIAENDFYRLEDSGDFLATLKASGVDFDTGQRSTVLRQVLSEGQAYWDQNTFEIRTDAFCEQDLLERMINFSARQSA